MILLTNRLISHYSLNSFKHLNSGHILAGMGTYIHLEFHSSMMPPYTLTLMVFSIAALVKNLIQ